MLLFVNNKKCARTNKVVKEETWSFRHFLSKYDKESALHSDVKKNQGILDFLSSSNLKSKVTPEIRVNA